MKSKRQEKIIEIVTNQVIETQDDLITSLKVCGFDVTQATISRDIRELKLVKVSAGDHCYRYAPSSHEEMEISVKYGEILKSTVTGVDLANNIVVLKTYSGMANAAAAAIDGMGWKEIVGSIAGDDNIFVLMRDSAGAEEFVSKFRKLLK